MIAGTMTPRTMTDTDQPPQSLPPRERTVVVIPKKGVGAPCKRLDCGCRNCEEVRQIVKAKCTGCRKAIGFDTKFHHNNWVEFVHVACVK